MCSTWNFFAMSFGIVGKIVRKVYDATSKSSSSFGKVGKYAWPFSAPYYTRDLWRRYGKSRFGGSVANSQGVYSAGSSRSLVGNTGFHRYT